MSKYLFGASIQGIQSFIFKTNKLKEIVGASQLVDNIVRKEFGEFCKRFNHPINEDNILLAAAGNIRYICDENTAANLVKGFPKYVAFYAPGITVSQALVKLNGKGLTKATDILEEKLKAQRNKVSVPMEIGFMGLERSRRTSGVGVAFEKGEVIDSATQKKTALREENTLSLFERFAGKRVKAENVPFNLSDITRKTENSWLAIVHADGNGLGNILQNLTANISSADEIKEVLRTFSKQLEAATIKAANEAFNQVIDNDWQKKIESGKDRYPIRPVVLGGDDLTVIIRADLAYDFTKTFLKSFELQTEKHFNQLNEYNVKKLTACAGIAYIKDSYPFHYGVRLAEALTEEAKKKSKNQDIIQNAGNDGLPPSSLAFYKVQSSFVEDLSSMRTRTHIINGINFNYGPYFIKEISDSAYVGELDEFLGILKEKSTDKSKAVSKLRQLLSELAVDKSKTEFMLKRIQTIDRSFYDSLNLGKFSTVLAGKKAEPLIVNDLIQLHTINNLY